MNKNKKIENNVTRKFPKIQELHLFIATPVSVTKQKLSG